MSSQLHESTLCSDILCRREVSNRAGRRNNRFGSSVNHVKNTLKISKNGSSLYKSHK